MDRRRHIAVVAGLLTLSCLVQVVLIRRATIPGLDAVRFVETARQIDTQGLLTTTRQYQEQPLFPAWVWLVHEGLERTRGQFRSSWATSVQLAAAIPLVLAVVPVYFLSLRLVGPRAAAAGSLLFCLLPEVSRLGADGLSDSTHLLFFCLAFWAALVYLGKSQGRQVKVRGPGSGIRDDRRDRVAATTAGVATAGSKPAASPIVARRRTHAVTRSPLPCPAPPSAGRPLWLLAVGVFAGLAILVRAEALLVPAALLATLVVLQLQRDRRQPWSTLAATASYLVLGCGLVLGPYLFAVGAIAPRAAVGQTLGRHKPQNKEADSLRPAPPITATSGDAWRLDAHEPMSFAAKDPTTSLRRRGCAAATAQFVEELADAFGYLIGAFCLLGVWRLRGSLVRPADRFAQVYFLLFSLAVLSFASKEGYVSARHMLSLVVVGIGCAGYGTLEVGRWIANWRRAGSRGGAKPERRQPAGVCRSLLAWSMVSLAAAFCLVEAVEPLHVSRLGHRLAAEWLAVEAEAPGLVLDTRGWTGLYSGRATYRYDEAQTAFGHPRLAYVVLEGRELEYPSGRSRTLRRLLDVAAEPVARFPDAAGVGRGQQVVVVYRWSAERFSRWVRGQSKGHQARDNRHARTRLGVHRERI